MAIHAAAVQCELARKFDFQLAVREQQLRRAHGAQWTAALGLASCRRPQIKFHRGFVERLELDVGDLAQIDVARTRAFTADRSSMQSG